MKIFAPTWETLASLKDRNFRLYITGQWISLVGTWMQNAAQAWLVWKMTNSPAALGILGMLSMIPFLFLGPFSGVIADRVDRKNLLFNIQIGAMSLAIVLALLIQFEVVQVWHVYTLATCLGCLEAIGLPAQQAFLGDLTGLHNIRKTVVINNMIFQVSRMVGPILAGWAIGWLNVAAAFWLNGLSFLAVIWTLTKVVVLQEKRTGNARGLDDFIDGFRFVLRSPFVQYLLVLTLIVTLFGFSSFQILAAYAEQALHGDSKTFGYLMGASGLGALIGAIVFVPITHQINRIGWVLGLGCVMSGLWLSVMGASRHLPLSLAAICLSSVTFPVVMVNINGLLQTMAPPGMRARLISLWMILGFGIQPLASIAIGYYAQIFGSPAAIVLNGTMMALAASSLLFFRSEFRRWNLRVTA